MAFAMLIVVLAFAVSCQPAAPAGGDLVDRGPSAAKDRYVLDLGTVRAGAMKQTLGPLASTEMVLGLEVAGLTQQAAEAATATVPEPVAVTLSPAGGGVVLHQEVPLGDWIWTCGAEGCEGAFAYLRQEGASPGTYFRPRRGQTYRLSLEIPDIAFFREHEVHIVARGGGWK
jgi:hypothetical protein